MRFAGGTASGFGRVLAIFGARTALSAPTLPLPLRSRKRAKERAPASWRISVRAPMPSARRAAMKARTSCGVSSARCERGRAAEMVGQKTEELRHVAAIGFERFRRHPPLVAEDTPASAQTRPPRRAPRKARSRLLDVGLAMTALSHRLPSPFLKRPESGECRRLMAMQIVDVVVPVALDQAYTYRVPAGIEPRPATWWRCRLGPSEYAGVVWGEGDPRPGLHNKLKDVDAKLDVPPLRPELRHFIDWVADYTLGARGMVLRMALRMGENLGPARERVGVRLAGPAAAAHDRGARARSARCSPMVWRARKAMPRKRPACRQA